MCNTVQLRNDTDMYFTIATLWCAMAQLRHPNMTCKSTLSLLMQSVRCSVHMLRDISIIYPVDFQSQVNARHAASHLHTVHTSMNVGSLRGSKLT